MRIIPTLWYAAAARNADDDHKAINRLEEPVIDTSELMDLPDAYEVGYHGGI